MNKLVEKTEAKSQDLLIQVEGRVGQEECWRFTGGWGYPPAHSCMSSHMKDGVLVMISHGKVEQEEWRVEYTAEQGDEAAEWEDHPRTKELLGYWSQYVGFRDRLEQQIYIRGQLRQFSLDSAKWIPRN